MSIQFNIPDLKERREDVPILALYFLNKFAKDQNKKVNGFHEEVIDFMKAQDWKGNIRELENFVERLVAMVQEDVSKITNEHFPADLKEKLSAFTKQKKLYSSTYR